MSPLSLPIAPSSLRGGLPDAGLGARGIEKAARNRSCQRLQVATAAGVSLAALTQAVYGIAPREVLNAFRHQRYRHTDAGPLACSPPLPHAGAGEAVRHMRASAMMTSSHPPGLPSPACGAVGIKGPRVWGGAGGGGRPSSDATRKIVTATRYDRRHIGALQGAPAGD